MEFKDLLGKTFTAVEKTDDELRFTDSEGRVYEMYHSQDCCESVYIESIAGDLNDLLGAPVLFAEEATSDVSLDSNADVSCTWTFYKLATRKGWVDIRWVGESNSYYSESVDIREVKS